MSFSTLLWMLSQLQLYVESFFFSFIFCSNCPCVVAAALTAWTGFVSTVSEWTCFDVLKVYVSVSVVFVSPMVSTEYCQNKDC